MKSRTCFISNSSSSSFLIMTKAPLIDKNAIQLQSPDKHDVAKALDTHGFIMMGANSTHDSPELSQISSAMLEGYEWLMYFEIDNRAHEDFKELMRKFEKSGIAKIVCEYLL